MRFVVCVLKSAVAFVVVGVVFVLVGLAIPDESWWVVVMVPMLFGCLITWNILTTRWSLAAHTGIRPVPWLRNSVRALPLWAKVGLAVLFSPILFGAGLLAHRGGLSLPVLIGAPVGLLVVLGLYRRVQGVR